MTPTLNTGISSNAILDSTGARASLGNNCWAAFTFLCASCNARSIFADCSNSIVTTETPSAEVDLTALTLSRLDTASSMYFVTEFSASCGEAPGYTVVIKIIGGLIFGNNSYLS